MDTSSHFSKQNANKSEGGSGLLHSTASYLQYLHEHSPTVRNKESSHTGQNVKHSELPITARSSLKKINSSRSADQLVPCQPTSIPTPPFKLVSNLIYLFIFDQNCEWKTPQEGFHSPSAAAGVKDEKGPLTLQHRGNTWTMILCEKPFKNKAKRSPGCTEVTDLKVKNKAEHRDPARRIL